MSTANKTIKNVPNNILARFTQIKAERDFTNDTETFVNIISEYGADKGEIAIKDQIEKLTADLAAANISLTDLKEANTTLTTENSGLKDQLVQVTNQVTKLSEERAGIITTSTDQENRIETLENQLKSRVELTGNQFVADFKETVFTMARKCRKFYMEDKKVLHQDEYPNHLINEAVPFYLKRKYEDIVNPL